MTGKKSRETQKGGVTMYQTRFFPMGDLAISVEFPQEISPDISKQIRAFNIALKNRRIGGILETVPTYCSVLIHYKPEIISYGDLLAELQGILAQSSEITLPPSSVVEIPVLYGGDYGPDLDFVASYNNISPETVVKIHSSGEYLIYMLGFTPGFPYLGGMDERIATPRLESPRVKIPRGSVGIAGNQTGVYPVSSPGGWQLIGQTPILLYDVESTMPILLEAGQYVKFKPINEKEFGAISNAVARGDYEAKRYSKED